MLDIGRNHGNDILCCRCNHANENTENIISCPLAQEFVGHNNPANLENMSDRTNLLHLHTFMSTYIELMHCTKKEKHQLGEEEEY